MKRRNRGRRVIAGLIASFLLAAATAWSQQVADFFILPVAGYSEQITQSFGALNPDHIDPSTGEPKRHTGDDVSGTAAVTQVLAAASGRVMFARQRGTCHDNWGHVLVIEHVLSDNTRVNSIYGHLDPGSIAVAEGQTVTRGTVLGRIGRYPCWGDHLHFAIRQGAFGAAVGEYPAWLAGYLVQAGFPASYQAPLAFIANHSAPPVPIAVVGGTFVDRTGAVVGTSFLIDPNVQPGRVSFWDVTGPTGWNSGSVYRCPDYQPNGTAQNRSICWMFEPAISGQYTAQGLVGAIPVVGSFQINSNSRLTAPQIISFVRGLVSIDVSWEAPPIGARSFLVRLSRFPPSNPFQASDIVQETVVAGATRFTSLSVASLVPGQDYRIDVFAFSHDVRIPDPLVSPFNMASDSVIFTAVR
jgi:murein DD-endopeptidase MepM/ murein hydrolase activator NlpD